MDDNIVVLIEDTTLKLQRLLSTMVNDRIKRDIIGTEAKRIINECIKKLTEAGCTKEFIEKQRQAFMSTFTNWYMQITTNLAKLAQKTKNPTFYQSYKEITGIEPKISGKSIIINVGAKSDYGDNIELGGVKNIRDYFTTGETGYSQMFVEDYQKRVNREIMKIASMNVVLVNRKGRTMSARNLAEMQVRFEEQVKDFDKLDKKGVKYVVATSHANASERCQPWQGKIFELDAKVGDVKIGKEIQHGEPTPKGKMPDGKNYYSLKEAMEKGFLGYNCRHRIIEYKSGMVMPKQYTENQINKERNIEQTARSLERQIRNAKKKSMLANNSLDRKKYQEQSKKLQDTYWDYCKEHDYAVAEWRTRVALNEREGIKSGSISGVPNDNNQGETYGHRKMLENLDKYEDFEHESNNDVVTINKIKGIKNRINEYSDYGTLRKDYSKHLPNIKKVDKTIVLTKDREKHILERHPELKEKIGKLLQYINNPDGVEIDKKHNNTLNVYKFVDDEHVIYISVKFTEATSNLSNSIITARYMNKKRIKK